MYTYLYINTQFIIYYFRNITFNIRLISSNSQFGWLYLHIHKQSMYKNNFAINHRHLQKDLLLIIWTFRRNNFSYWQAERVLNSIRRNISKMEIEIIKIPEQVLNKFICLFLFRTINRVEQKVHKPTNLWLL